MPSVDPKDISLKALTELPEGKFISRDGHRVFPGRGDHPFRVEEGSDLPYVKEEEVQKVYSARVEILNLEDTDDKKRYQTIMSDCANAKAVLGSEQVIHNDKKGYWEVYVKWYEIFEEKKPKRRR